MHHAIRVALARHALPTAQASRRLPLPGSPEAIPHSLIQQVQPFPTARDSFRIHTRRTVVHVCQPPSHSPMGKNCILFQWLRWIASTFFPSPYLEPITFSGHGTCAKAHHSHLSA